jgi:hypothetical protein
MKTKEYTTIYKSNWSFGPWQNEPDKVQWQDQTTGLPCLAVRNPYFGHWCGYVGVNENHKYFNANWDEISVDVHGGPTFSDFCQPTETEESGICHLPGEGEPDRVWWIGFDCNHSFDYAPAPMGGRFQSSRNYKSLIYVKEQCEKLALQLKQMD